MPFLHKKSFTIVLLILVSISMVTTLSILPEAEAATTIVSVTPTQVNVGAIINLKANISSVNGTYNLLWDDAFWDSGNATGNAVNASLTIRSATAGNHTITVVDVDKGENASTVIAVLTAYSLDVLPKIESPIQRQEGDPVQFFLNMTGGQVDVSNIANITVVAPNNATYSKLATIATESDGNGSLNVNYPQDFPVGANTNFTGGYQVLFNNTLAKTSFLIGLTNSTEYHRFQTLDVKAVYNSFANATLTITGGDFQHSENLTADANGIIHYASSVVLSNATIGVYTVNITSLSITKSPPDTQSFAVPGFAVNLTARNLAGKTVADVGVHVFENEKSVENVTSDSDGLARFQLEVGNYRCEAFFKNVKVGEQLIAISQAESLDLPCNLTSIRFYVIDEDGNKIPKVEVYLTPENQTFVTDNDGAAVAYSLLPDVAYNMNFSRYGTLFNETSVSNLIVDEKIVALFNISVNCPKMTLKLNVTDADRQPINNATIRASEANGGLNYMVTTTDGSATLNCTLGRYLVETYVGEIELNETTVNVNNTVVVLPIYCSLYGLNAYVKVVDYFGQPIANVNITLQRDGLQDSRITGSDGVALFSDTIGGLSQVIIRLAGGTEPYVVVTASVDKQPTTVEVRIEKYVTLAGSLVEMSTLITVILILLTLIAAFSLEIVRRKKSKSHSQDKEL